MKYVDDAEDYPSQRAGDTTKKRGRSPAAVHMPRWRVCIVPTRGEVVTRVEASRFLMWLDPDVAIEKSSSFLPDREMGASRLCDVVCPAPPE
jgi:hypothetical protein